MTTAPPLGRCPDTVAAGVTVAAADPDSSAHHPVIGNPTTDVGGPGAGNVNGNVNGNVIGYAKLPAMNGTIPFVPYSGAAATAASEWFRVVDITVPVADAQLEINPVTHVGNETVSAVE
jgi:hypothetical protein